MQAQLQPIQEARAEDEEMGLCLVFMDEARFNMSPVEDTYACAVARRMSWLFKSQQKSRPILQQRREWLIVDKLLPSKTENNIPLQEYVVQGRLRYET